MQSIAIILHFFKRNIYFEELKLKMTTELLKINKNLYGIHTMNKSCKGNPDPF